jgi:hypothetical protein
MQNLLSLNIAKQQKIPHPQCLNLGGDYTTTREYTSHFAPHTGQAACFSAIALTPAKVVLIGDP